jgi:hypothetical protein
MAVERRDDRSQHTPITNDTVLRELDLLYDIVSATLMRSLLGQIWSRDLVNEEVGIVPQAFAAVD